MFLAFVGALACTGAAVSGPEVNKVPEAPAAAEANPASDGVAAGPEQGATDPPPPEGVTLPKKYGDLPAGPGPTDRRSTWSVHLGAAPVTVEVPCDARSHEGLRAVLNAVFRGVAPTADNPGDPGGEPLVTITWKEGGSSGPTTRLYANGTLTRVEDDSERVERVLSAAEVEVVKQAIRDAGVDQLGFDPC